MPATPRAGAIWAALSFIAFALALVLSLPILGFLTWTLALPHRSSLAAWPLVWGTFSIVACILAAELVFALRPRITTRALAVAAGGLGLAAGTQLALFEWSVARYGRIDPELVGWTGWAFAVMVALATAGFGVLIAPGRSVAWPAAVALVASVATIAIGASNLGGLTDGPGASTWPLAVALGMDGLYALAIAGISMVALRGGQPIVKRLPAGSDSV